MSDQARWDEMADRLFRAFLGGAELLAIELGRRLRLYDVLRDSGPIGAAEFAARAGIAERYATEWLEQQAAAGILDVVDASLPAASRRFTLPAALHPVLLEPDHPAYLMGFAPSLAALASTLPDVASAYRSGEGVPYPRFGEEMRVGIAEFNRPGFRNEMRAWIGTLPDIASRLDRGGTVIDAGCGLGWSTISIAESFPNAKVIGIDLDDASIHAARGNADEAGVAGRVAFERADAVSARNLRADLVTVFEALHDMGEPVDALRSFRSALTPGAAVLVADERVADSFAAPADEVERMMYAFSVLHCLPATLAESASIAHGTVLRAPTVREWAERAGFDTCVELDIEHPFWRFYRLD